MVTITMEQMIDFKNNDDFFSEANIPLKGAYKINKIKQAIEKESGFYNEKFQEIIDTYARKNDNGELIFSEDGEQIMIDPERIDECNQALNDLQQLTIEIDNLNLKIEDLGENLQCTPDELAALMPFME